MAVQCRGVLVSRRKGVSLRARRLAEGAGRRYRDAVEDLLGWLATCAQEIGATLEPRARRGFSGARASQYHLDVVADEVARRVLHRPGWRIVSEESGSSGQGDRVVVVDPIDGSTNADRGIPFYSTSLAVLDHGVLVAGCVRSHATGTTYLAERGAGAVRDGETLRASGQREIAGSLIGFSGWPRRRVGWGQFRALGAASLELCLVAEGSMDAFTVAGGSQLYPWDYLAGLLIAREADAWATDGAGDELVTDAPVARRPIVAATQDLLAELLALGPL